MNYARDVPKTHIDSLATRRLAYVLRWLRDRDGLSQAAMGQRIGASQAQINKLEHGETENAGVYWIEQLAKVFQVPYGYFFAPGRAELDLAEYMRGASVEARLEALERSTHRDDGNGPGGTPSSFLRSETSIELRSPRRRR